MKKLCIIPARGGSKRLPNKNIIKLHNKPLVFYTIDACLKSKIFDKIIFTSDNQEIIDLVEQNYNEKILETHIRPESLATDTSKVIDTVLHYLDESFNQTWLSLPTAPLKNHIDFQKVDKILSDEVKSVISYTEMEFPPSLGLVVNEQGYISDSHESKPWVNGNSRSQDHPIIYRPNGAIYASWTDELRKNKNFYTDNTKGYFMKREDSIDIDNLIDFQFVEFLMKTKRTIE